MNKTSKQMPTNDSMVDAVDVLVIGGGASGLMCASQAALRGLSVLLLEKGPKIGLKILVSGGGRCNFTNLYADPEEQYLSDNPHFAISAMRRFQPWDFIGMVEDRGIEYHEKKLGQLFCDHSAKDIAGMLLEDCQTAGVDVRVNHEVVAVNALDEQEKNGGGYRVSTAQAHFTARKVVLASGGLSLPKIASDLAYRVANELHIPVIAPRPALVPLTWNSVDKLRYADLSGISVDAQVSCGDGSFRENILFTHRGLSGPAILQVSSYWREGETVEIDLLPELDLAAWLLEERTTNPQQKIANALKRNLPNRLIETMTDVWFEDTKIGTASPTQLTELAGKINNWHFKPGGSEGYRTAEVTLGGIDTREVSSKTFELNKAPGMYAIGEALDVTGWLGGYNFQWAWASGWCCGQYL
ncbi:MAG: putative Rossmann fold flavoprotein [Limisphaerales bacterium]|jgi:predicted Rossmann fold flavoprotein